MEKLEIVYVPISELIPNEKNPRINEENIGRVEKSISHYGWTNPILARREDKKIIAGHTRLEAAKLKNETEVPVIYLEMNEADALSYMITDNKLTELAEWDEAKLTTLFQELKNFDLDLTLTGFAEKEIKAFTLTPDNLTDSFKLYDGEKPPFQQMKFTLSDKEAETVKEALKKVKAEEQIENPDNLNSNGNAIAKICELYICQQKILS